MAVVPECYPKLTPITLLTLICNQITRASDERISLNKAALDPKWVHILTAFADAIDVLKEESPDPYPTEWKAGVAYTYAEGYVVCSILSKLCRSTSVSKLNHSAISTINPGFDPIQRIMSGVMIILSKTTSTNEDFTHYSHANSLNIPFTIDWYDDMTVDELINRIREVCSMINSSLELQYQKIMEADTITTEHYHVQEAHPTVM